MTLTPWQMLLIPLGMVLVAGVFVTINRYIAYRERVELARLGFSLEELNRHADRAHRGNRGVLWGGVITAAGGAALLLGLSTLGSGVWLLGGLIPLFVGLGMILIYVVTRGAPAESRAADGEEPNDERAVRLLDGQPTGTFGTRVPDAGPREGDAGASATTRHMPGHD